MRPSKSMVKRMAERSERDFDLEALWEALGEEPPGPIIQIRSAKAGKGQRTPKDEKKS